MKVHLKHFAGRILIVLLMLFFTSSAPLADEVKEITGFTIGGVSPVGHLKPLEIYIDEELSRFKNIYAAAGHPNCIFKIDFDNLTKITKGSVKNITE